MKNIIYLTLFVAILIPAKSSFAQQPCGVVVGAGPIGVGVMVPCPPPPPPPPPQRVIVVRRHHDNVPPQEPKVATTVPVPGDLNNLDITDVNRWTVGIMFDSTSSDEGGLAGSMVFGRFLFLENLSFELGFASLSSCTNCNSLAHRKDSRVHFSTNWYWNRIKHSGFNPFLKAGFIFSNITMYNDSDASSYTSAVSGVEIGGGIEWRIIPWLSLEVQGTFMSNEQSPDDTDDYGTIDSHLRNGIAPVNASGFNFRFGINVNF
ncbi:MAG: hypothetical protein JXR95_14140 [Deltaproteobacteria bacterium]|nr:hypothetical protein [Deltaproteobacteria bacterium]